MTGIDEKGMVILRKEVVYLSLKMAGSPDLFTQLLTVMTKPPLGKVTGLLLLGLGSYYLATGVFSALSLLLARTESGVVESASLSPRGEPATCPCVVWGRGLVFIPQPGDWDSVPRVGDHVTVLAYCEGYSAGVLKSGRVLWRVWKRAGGFTTVGVILLAGYYVLQRRPIPHEIHVTQTV